jgi:hypothetical protein
MASCVALGSDVPGLRVGLCPYRISTLLVTTLPQADQGAFYMGGGDRRRKFNAVAITGYKMYKPMLLPVTWRRIISAGKASWQELPFPCMTM